jgi:phosphoesterase RecJ-like protein
MLDNPYTEFNQRFHRLIDQSQTIIVTSHISPDEDAIASVLAVYFVLTQNYPHKQVKMVYTGQSVARWQTFLNYDEIQFVDDLADHLADVDTIIFLDGNQYGRFSNQPEKLGTFSGQTICIDHHASLPTDFTLSLVEPAATSTAELVYRTLVDQQVRVWPSLAQALLMGIIGDTGNFVYVNPGQAEILTIAAKLVTDGQIDIQNFRTQFNTIEQSIFLTVQELFKNTEFHHIPGYPPLQLSLLQRPFVEQLQLLDNQISMASHAYMRPFLTTVEGYQWGVVITPRAQGKCSLSFRSLPGAVSVRQIAEQFGAGGGHNLASGCTLEPINSQPVSISDTRQQLLDWLHQNPA